jgi:isoleucyl-tRNA synthetase
LEGVAEGQRKFFGTLYNTYSFFAIYANIDGFEFNPDKTTPLAERTELDRWIYSKLQSLVKKVRTCMDDYDPTPAARAIEEFVSDHLSNWHVRLSRRRFWKGEMNEDKQAAYETLYECLMVTSQLMSPIAPFFSDWLYKNLGGKLESVHLTNLPEVNEEAIDSVLEEQMDYAQRISSLVLSIRKRENIKVRQPLQTILIPLVDQKIKDEIVHVQNLILAEVNVKELSFIDAIDKSIKPNFKTLGKKVGGKMKAVAAIILELKQDKIVELEANGTCNISVEGEEISILLEDVEILSKEISGYKVANEGRLTVALDVSISPELKEEGIAREIISKLQGLRKEMNLDVTDKIQIKIEAHDYIKSSINQFKSYICTELLAASIEFDLALSIENTIEVDENRIQVSIQKA